MLQGYHLFASYEPFERKVKIFSAACAWSSLMDLSSPFSEDSLGRLELDTQAYIAKANELVMDFTDKKMFCCRLWRLTRSPSSKVALFVAGDMTFSRVMNACSYVIDLLSSALSEDAIGHLELGTHPYNAHDWSKYFGHEFEGQRMLLLVGLPPLHQNWW